MQLAKMIFMLIAMCCCNVALSFFLLGINTSGRFVFPKVFIVLELFRRLKFSSVVVCFVHVTHFFSLWLVHLVAVLASW